MRDRILLAMSCLALAAACSSTPQAPSHDPAADEAVIRRVIQDAVAAHHSGDAVQWAAVVSPDVVMMLDADSTVTGSRAAMEYVRALFERFTSTLEARIVEVQIDHDMAYVRTEDSGAFTPKAGGAPVAINYRELIVFRRQADGAWKATRLMVNRNVAQK